MTLIFPVINIRKKSTMVSAIDEISWESYDIVVITANHTKVDYDMIARSAKAVLIKMPWSVLSKTENISIIINVFKEKKKDLMNYALIGCGRISVNHQSKRKSMEYRSDLRYL